MRGNKKKDFRVSRRTFAKMAGATGIAAGLAKWTPRVLGQTSGSTSSIPPTYPTVKAGINDYADGAAGIAYDPTTAPSAVPCTTQKDGSGGNGQCACSTQSYTAFGMARNGSEIGPGFKNIDLSGYKTFAITEKQSIAFHADAFNTFNFANYNNPNNDSSDPVYFGQITSTKGNQRFIQLALNYRF